jgi:threonine/homoserine/homoserine lactone efflux protein
LLPLWQLDAGQPQPRPGPAMHYLRGQGMTREDWANILCALGIMLVGLVLAARWWLA